GVHAIELEVVVAHAGEDDRAVLRAHGALGVVAGGVRELAQVGAVGVGPEDVVAVVDGPDVALALIGLGRAGLAPEVGGGVDDLLIAGQEVGAGGGALAGRHELGLAGGVLRGAHVDLVAPVALVRLIDELAPVEGPVGLGVLAARGELDDVAQVHLFGVAVRIRGGRGLGHLGRGLRSGRRRRRLGLLAGDGQRGGDDRR